MSFCGHWPCRLLQPSKSQSTSEPDGFLSFWNLPVPAQPLDACMADPREQVVVGEWQADKSKQQGGCLLVLEWNGPPVPLFS